MSHLLFCSAGIHQIFNLHQTEKHPAKVKAPLSFLIKYNCKQQLCTAPLCAGCEACTVLQVSHHPSSSECIFRVCVEPCSLFSVPPGASAWTAWWSEWWNETTTSTWPTSQRGSSPSSSPRSWRSRGTGWTWRRWLPCSSPNTRKSFWWVERNAIRESAEKPSRGSVYSGSIQLNASEALLHHTVWHLATGSCKIETHK